MILITSPSFDVYGGSRRPANEGKIKEATTHQFLNLGIVQAGNIILRNPIRKHQRIRLNRLCALDILGALAASELVVRPRVVGSRVHTHAVPIRPLDVTSPLGRPAATAGKATGGEVPVGRDAAVGNGGGVSGAANVGVDAAANGGGAGAVIGAMEVDVDGGGGGD